MSNKSRKRILVIGVVSSSLINFRGSLLKELVVSGHDVHVAANQLDQDIRSKKKLLEIGVSTHNVSISRTGVNPFIDLYTLVNLIRLYLKLRPNIVLSYTTKPVIWGGLAALFFPSMKYFALITGLGYAFTESVSGKRLLLKNILQLLYKIGLSHASGVIFQNPDDKNEFHEMKLVSKNTKIKVVNGSGVNLDDFPIAPFPKEKINFLMIARLLGDKGVREYIDAGRILNNQGIKAEFNLVGPRDTNPDGLTDDEIKSWQNLDWLQWHGTSKDVRSHYEKNFVYVLPSYREGTPRTVLEAMATGRPVITTDTPGCRETVISEVNGFLVPIKNSKELASSMKKFIDNPELAQRMGKESRAIAEKKYDVDKVNKEMINAMELD